MGDEAKRYKNLRKVKLAAFTRKHKSLQGLLDAEENAERLEESLRELHEAFKVAEKANDDYVAIIEEDELETELGYMDAPTTTLETLTNKVKDRLKSLKDSERSTAVQSKFKLGIQNFGTPSVLITQLSSENKISLKDMRAELDKVEASFDIIKADLMKLDARGDLNDLLEEYNTKVVEEVDRCKRVALEYLKDSTPAPVTGGGSSSSTDGVSSRPYSTTKRETVMLPHFSGDEKSAYLKYPVWKQQWTEHIAEYEDKYRATMLMNHLDEKAQSQIVGLETDYEAAIKQLDSYYSDAKKIIRACLDELRGQPQISQFDYKGLVQYKKCLTNNHARLKAAKLEHEMSNTAAMGAIIRKFPIQEAVEWQKYLSEQSQAEQNSPFESFIKWLSKAAASWELLAAAGTGVKGKSGSMQVQEKNSTIRDKKTCYKCGKEGHMKRDCKQKDSKVTGGGQAGSNSGRKPRNPPIHKKHHCAFHKGAPDRFCYTWSCPSVKYLQYGDRVKLLRENLDCEVCCGDCPNGNCLAKSKRVCGGNKDGRGCGTNHVGHELWCSNAKLCFAVSSETVLSIGEDEEDGVLLQVMKIPSLDKSADYETVLWDTACTGLFVRNEHARKMNFPCKERRLRVCTLGGVIKEIDGLIFECQITDLKGNVYEFLAHGLDQVTGALNTMLSEDLMRQLFPNVIGGHRMCGATEVDYLIGLSKVSWQPTRSIQASGGGDFWI